MKNMRKEREMLDRIREKLQRERDLNRASSSKGWNDRRQGKRWAEDKFNELMKAADVIQRKEEEAKRLERKRKRDEEREEIKKRVRIEETERFKIRSEQAKNQQKIEDIIKIIQYMYHSLLVINN